jgi:hypothetical protein
MSIVVVLETSPLEKTNFPGKSFILTSIAEDGKVPTVSILSIPSVGSRKILISKNAYFSCKFKLL